MKPRSSYWLASILSLVGASVFAFGGCSVTEGTTEEDGHVDTADQELTAEQCNYFAVNGKVQICHRTGSVSNPYRVLKISEQACINAHALHAGDYVAVNDPTCQGGGCLPEAAPCDATLPCCEGFSCTNGTCTANVSDHCSPSPCQNGSTCANDANGYTCTCLAGYTGTNCEIEIDECASNPCVHGVCLDAINAYECQCPVGWTGTNCEIDINECDTNPCINGDCLDLVGGYECSCLPGWEGYECQNDINECASNPCLNGGTCTNGVNSYTCACPAGWDGTNCENDINECDANPCVHGECEDQIAQYECLCNPGWDGNECQNNINECASNPCLNGGTCADGANSYTCTCPAGWTGTNCETPDGATCPCEVQNPGVWAEGVGAGAMFPWACVINSPTSASIQEGDLWASAQNGQCYATSPSTYETVYADSLTNDEQAACAADIIAVCPQPGPCNPDPCQNGTCTVNGGSYTCGCEAGWTGTNCDQLDGTATCPCAENYPANWAASLAYASATTCTLQPAYTSALIVRNGALDVAVGSSYCEMYEPGPSYEFLQISSAQAAACYALVDQACP